MKHFTRSPEPSCYKGNYRVTLPSVLNVKHLGETRKRRSVFSLIMSLLSASLLTLAVVSRPGLNVTLEDMARLFNNETLRWHNAVTFVPQHYCQHIGRETRITFDHEQLSIHTWRLATFLSDTENKSGRTSDQKRILLLNHYENSKNDNEKSQLVQVEVYILLNVKFPLHFGRKKHEEYS